MSNQTVPCPTFFANGQMVEPFNGATLVSVERIADTIAAWALIPSKCKVVDIGDGEKYYHASDLIKALEE